MAAGFSATLSLCYDEGDLMYVKDDFRASLTAWFGCQCRLLGTIWQCFTFSKRVTPVNRQIGGQDVRTLA